jgi:hypothetical protein
MTSSHSCPQYSQLKAVTEIARVQPEHRFQVITRTVRQAPYHGAERAFSRPVSRPSAWPEPCRASELRGR